MAEKCAELKTHLTNKEKEADYMREVDLRDLSRDAERMIQHRKAMTVFRDENKRVQTHTNSHTFTANAFEMNAWASKCYILLSDLRLQHKGGFENVPIICPFVQLMEERWRDLALRRSQEAFRERGLLCLNPINWSGTLK